MSRSCWQMHEPLLSLRKHCTTVAWQYNQSVSNQPHVILSGGTAAIQHTQLCSFAHSDRLSIQRQNISWPGSHLVQFPRHR